MRKTRARKRITGESGKRFLTGSEEYKRELLVGVLLTVIDLCKIPSVLIRICQKSVIKS
jgi:hypothetical protein